MKDIDVHNTFSPGQEIVDPDKFAGRNNKIAQAIKALCRQGTSILVYGERGVGKSSFIEMVKLIAQDQVELIYRYKLQNLRPPNGFKYKVICIECDDDVDTTEKVLQRLISSPEGISGLIGPQIEKIEATMKNKVSLSFFKQVIGIEGSYEEKQTKKQFKSTSIYELFTNLILSITKNILEPDEGILIVIDEFDRVQENSKMASLIKTLSKGKIKFLIAGIASSYFELIKGHASIERQLFQGKIKIDPMLESEIENIFDLAESNSNKLIIFERSFREEVKKRSYGYPYYAQLFGQIALDNFVKVYGNACKASITKENLIEGLKEFSNNEPKLDQIYKYLIGDDPKRELLLKALAIQIPSRIQQSNVFTYCSKRDFPQPKSSLSYFLSVRDPQVLIRISEDLISFVDPLFKIYAGIRDPIYLRIRETDYCLPEIQE